MHRLVDATEEKNVKFVLAAIIITAGMTSIVRYLILISYKVSNTLNRELSTVGEKNMNSIDVILFSVNQSQTYAS